LSITCYQEIAEISGSESHTRKKKRGVSINSVPTQLQFSLRVDGFQENRRRAAFHLPISSVTASFTRHFSCSNLGFIELHATLLHGWLAGWLASKQRMCVWMTQHGKKEHGKVIGSLD